MAVSASQVIELASKDPEATFELTGEVVTKIVQRATSDGYSKGYEAATRTIAKSLRVVPTNAADLAIAKSNNRAMVTGIVAITVLFGGCLYFGSKPSSKTAE